MSIWGIAWTLYCFTTGVVQSTISILRTAISGSVLAICSKVWGDLFAWTTPIGIEVDNCHIPKGKVFCYVDLLAMTDDLDPLTAIGNKRRAFDKNERKLSRARRSHDIKNAILKTGRRPCLKTIC